MVYNFMLVAQEFMNLKKKDTLNALQFQILKHIISIVIKDAFKAQAPQLPGVAICLTSSIFKFFFPFSSTSSPFSRPSGCLEKP